MTRVALLALLLMPLGCTVNALPGSESNRLGNSDGGSGNVDLAGGSHGDGGGCGGGNVDLAGGSWPDGGFGSDAWFVDLGYGPYDGGASDAGPYDGGHVDLAH